MALAHPTVAQVGVPTYLTEALTAFVNFLPQLVGALIVLLIGWVVGRLVGAVVRRVVEQTTIDRLVAATPLGGALGGSKRAISRSLGRVTSYFVYALAVLAAADALAVDLLSEWIAAAVSYLPAFVAGALIIVIGFVLADFLADVVASTETTTDVRYTEAFADGLRVFGCFVAVVVGLDTMGVGVQILYLFSGALAGGLALGAALALGLAFGLGGRDYVAANVDSWLSGRSVAGERGAATAGQTDGGEEPTD
jgi:small-conductance mechanosensitive channel